MAKNRALKNIMVTGGAGFIGSNFIRYLLGFGGAEFQDSDFSGRVVNVDKLTYAGNLENLAEVEAKFGKNSESPRYFFEKADICDTAKIGEILRKYDIDAIVHFAAESHVDRSILGPTEFIRTNVLGTQTLLECARKFWAADGKFKDGVVFHHVSTDEVFGSLGDAGFFREDTPYAPRSPYSASKASSDMIAHAYFHTFGLPLTMSNCSNNYGPFQFPEKLIPLMVLNMRDGKSLPLYGEGVNVRDWIYVEDHNRAVWQIVREGEAGESYNIGGENEWKNAELLHRLIEIVAGETGKSAVEIEATIRHVKDRPGHDLRYAIDCSKIKRELGWKRKMTFDEGLLATVRWYLRHNDWISRVQSGEYAKWIENNYGER